jgi:mannosyltransferase
MLEKIKDNYLLVSIIVIGAILRFYHIDFQSIWIDEIHTMSESNPNLPISEIYEKVVSGEQMPPLYFYSLYILLKIFGYTTIVARLYSAIIGVVSLYSLYILSKEMFNKRVGLIASIILCFNPFHLYYSQEARPYIFLFLFTTLSFFYLIKFLKNQNLKNAVLYGLMSTLMIYSHFFGLFVLISQYLLLLVFFILSEKENKKRFLINSIISAVIPLVLFIPAISILLSITKITTFWIPAPTVDVYTLVFKEFFGNSEIVLSLLGILFFFYFISLSKEKEDKINYYSIIENKNILGFIIFIFWIVVVILIPLIRSYLSVPMIISRYFITLLPAIIIIISVAINQFSNKIVKIVIVSILVIFSLTDIIVIKKYYNGVSKAQFRETTDFIIKNNKNNEKVVSSLGVYLPFFLKNEKTNYEIIEKSLDDYITEIQSDTTKLKPFWYVDGFGRDYKPNDVSLAFIKKHFYIENNYDGFQAWTKHFILLKDVPKTVDISKFKELKKNNGDVFNFNFDTFDNVNNELKISGWACFENQNSESTVIDVLLIKDKMATRLFTQKVIRKDVTSFFKNSFNFDDCGFNSNYDTSTLEKGNYQIAIYLLDKVTKKEGLILTDKKFEKQ